MKPISLPSHHYASAWKTDTMRSTAEMNVLGRQYAEASDETAPGVLVAAGDGATLAAPLGTRPSPLDGGRWSLPEAPHRGANWLGKAMAGAEQRPNQPPRRWLGKAVKISLTPPDTSMMMIGLPVAARKERGCRRATKVAAGQPSQIQGPR